MNTLEIEAVGLACPLGLRRPAALAAMKAKIRAFRAPNQGPCRSVLREPKLDDQRLERARFFLGHAIDEVIEHSTTEPRRLVVLLIAPEPITASSGDVGNLLATIEMRLAKAAWTPACIEVHHGRAGAIAALDAARRALDAGVERALLVATECLTTDSVIDQLGARGCLLGQTRDEGVIPGEGAAAAMLRSPAIVWPRPAPARLTFVEHAVASDATPAWSASATALAQACQDLKAAGLARVDRLLSTSFPRRSSSSTLSVTCMRGRGHVPAPANAEYLGADLGELGGAALLATLARAFDLGPALILDHELADRVMVCAVENS